MGTTHIAGTRRKETRLQIVWLSLRRLLWIVRVLCAHGLAWAVRRWAVRSPRLARRLPASTLDGPEQLRTLFEDLGGTFVKFGQMLAMQPDVLPLAYCDALLGLLDRIEPFPWPEAESIVAGELGRTPDEIFDSISRQPIATASVGQVYVAWLSGCKVAVKVQRPHVEIEFNNDVRLLVVFMHLIRWLRIRPLYWLIAPTSEFVAWSAEELDYRNEARYGEELRRHAVDNPIQHVPRVYPELTSRRTLVAEFLEGVTLLDFMRARDRGDAAVLARVQELGFDSERFASNVISNFLGDAFRYGIYHADLHPANLMILADNVVGYIDFGITGLMSHYSRRHLVAMTLALAEGDVDTMFHEYLAITSHDRSSDLRAFRKRLAQLSAEWYEQDRDGRRLRLTVTRIFDQMLQLSRQTNVMPERDIVKYIRSAIYIDGLLARFVPGFDIGQHLAASCSGFMKWEARWSLLTPESMLDWSLAGSRLLLDGPARASRAFERREERDRASEREPPELDTAAEPAGVLRLGAAILGVSALFAFSPISGGVGLNLWTAELAFLLAAFAALALALRRLHD